MHGDVLAMFIFFVRLATFIDLYKTLYIKFETRNFKLQ